MPCFLPLRVVRNTSASVHWVVRGESADLAQADEAAARHKIYRAAALIARAADLTKPGPW